MQRPGYTRGKSSGLELALERSRSTRAVPRGKNMVPNRYYSTIKYYKVLYFLGYYKSAIFLIKTGKGAIFTMLVYT